jgi:pimeloyl-ACP methyl ester carboxylesterase
LGRVDVIGWSDNGKAFLRYDNQVHEVVPDAAGDFQIGQSSPLQVPARTATERLGVSGSRTASEEADRFSGANASLGDAQARTSALRLLALDSSDKPAWIGREADADAFVQTSSGRTPLPSLLGSTVYSTPTVSRRGTVLNLSLPGWSLHQRRTPYEQPLLSAHGDEMGSFTPDGVQVGGDLAWLGGGTTAYATANPSFTLDAVSVFDTETAYLLASNVSGDTSLIRMTPTGYTETTCRAAEAEGRDLAWDVSSLSSGERAIGVNHFRGPGERRGVVIYFHGGPTTSFRDGSYDGVVRHYAGLGFDVVAVDGVGSRDTGFLSVAELRTGAVAAIDGDAAALAAYLKGLASPYRTVVVHGESFGAAQAIVTADLIGPEATVLVAPWLNHRPVEQLFTGAGASSRIETQRIWEAAVFGPRDTPQNTQFRLWLSSLSARSAFEDNTLIVFAARDRISRPDDVTPGDAKVFVDQTTNHDRVTTSELTWDQVDAHLASFATAP